MEFEKKLAELVPHSPLGWDSDSLADALAIALGSTHGMVIVNEAVAPPWFGSRNTIWVKAYYSSPVVEDLVRLLREAMEEMLADSIVDIDVEISIVKKGRQESPRNDIFVAIHTPKA